MKKVDIAYISNFIDEVESLYEADLDADWIPEYIEDQIKNIRVILVEELKKNNE